MRVFVTGGTGAVGSHTVPALVAAGHTVSALARTPAKAAVLAAQGAAPVQVSLFDREALTTAFADHDAVVNMATALPSTARFMLASAWRECERIRTEGSATVVDAALAAGVGRLVQESVSMIYPDSGASWVDENPPIDHFPLAALNIAAEASADRFTEAGGNGIVLRFGLFYGPGAAHSEEMFTLARRHVGVVLGQPDSYVSSIHVADAAQAAEAALRAEAGIYNVVDDEPVTKREFANACADAAGAANWVRVPGRAALLVGDRATSLTRSLRVRNTKLRTETGWAPLFPSAREGWKATAAVLLGAER